MPASPLVLIVDDAPEVAELLDPLLQRDGYRTSQASTGAGALERAALERPDVVVLDIGLPDMDGIDVCRRLRAELDPLVLMLTSRTDDVDRIVGLSAGADDYVGKPFSPAEVSLRIAAMLRRRDAPPMVAGPSPVKEPLRRGVLEIDVDAHIVRVEGTPVELTRIEFDLLRQLVEHPNQVLTKDQLHERVWGPNWFTTSHVLDVHVSNLRRKLGDPPRAARFVQVVRGVGYRLGPCTRSDDAASSERA